ncbi:MAG: MOSC domain-containing protein [Acidobacteriota bacterium]
MSSFFGTIEEIWIGPEAKAELRSVDTVRAVAGRGLEGDRYFLRRGSFDRARWGDQSTSSTGRAVTLIDRRALEAARDRLELEGFTGGEARRNLVVSVEPTAGVDADLRDLVGATFRGAEVEFRGVRLAPPCRLLERIAGLDLRRGLKGVGGLRADVVRGGRIRVGDRLELVNPGRGRVPG